MRFAIAQITHTTEEVMPVFDLDVIARVAEERGVSLYEAEAELAALFAKGEEEEGE